VVTHGVDAHGRPVKSHVTRVIDPATAPTVQRIFTLYAEGHGHKSIATILTQEHAPTPRPEHRAAGWSPTSVRAILDREEYVGVYKYNATRKRPITWGQVDQQPRPAADHIRTPLPKDRQIISEELWARVRARRRDVVGKAARFSSGRLSGRPPKTPTQNLLAGLATCARCGSGLIVETSPRKGRRVSEYVCGQHRRNGSCANGLRISVEELNEAILQAIEEHALTPDAIEQVIHLADREELADARQRIEASLVDVERRLLRLVEAIETGSESATLSARLSELEAQRDGLRADLARLRPLPRLAPAAITSRLAEWRRLLRGSTTQARTVIQKIVKGRITFELFEEDEDRLAGYTFRAETRFDGLFEGVASECPASAVRGDRRGRENIDPMRDTMGGEYEQLLAAAYGKGMASPTGFEPVF
jgi:site-specific DNA recombinase